ncbi:hypothetical protein [Vibrio marisflavi]|uniref:PTS EIIA type-4 domain-containing protein n=1 Tax=Vibrio marisflavi CECT 7928 TaxID=634439 RepID=A0ABN8E194_9VIBR|nr:hypothetical protein [Vibrio marisflavi]CAH0537269.1 hypothetical protein VMF7928_01024 [Vibrio marisflavi CECT 7928]
MIAVILPGHGTFVHGHGQTLHKVISEQMKFKAFDYPVGMNTSQLEPAMQASIEEIDSGEGIALLTDLLGDTPFRIVNLKPRPKSRAYKEQK